ncbi:MAG TPA: aldolase/citrate lyase family protein [Chloroflexota bacterium]|nr:aldolase/citrate lyase family protein [Chloroflexota bacterium]
MPISVNPMKAALAAGQVQLGTWINLARNPAILTLLKSAGLDYARLDMEHSSPSIETMADFAILARALNFPLVVRPPEGNREWITRLLDNGVWGLHIPQVDNADIAHRVAEYARYAPDGMRGMGGLGPNNDFAPSGNTRADQAHMNAQVHLTVMFESAEAFRELDAICSVPGIDAVTLGPTDLAQELGVYGTPDEARVIDEHRLRLIEAAKKHGKDVAMLVGSLDQAERWIKEGVKLIAYSSDTAILRDGYRAAATRLKL